MASPAIGRRARWAPGPNVRIDWSHPLAAGLVLCVPGRMPFIDLVTGRIIPTIGSPVRQATRFGEGIYCDASGQGARLALATTDPWCLQYPYSYLFVGANIGTSTTGSEWVGVTATNDNSSPYLGWALGTAGGGGGALQGQLNDLATFIASDIATNESACRSELLAVLSYASGYQRAWVNGTQTITGGSTLASVTYTTPEFVIGCYSSGSAARGMNSVVNLCCAWKRTLSDTEAAQLYADPFCFLRY